MQELIRDIKYVFVRLQLSFPSMLLVWLDIVAHTSWRGARSLEGLNKARIKVSKAVRHYFVRNGGLVIQHFELEQETWR